jgi:molecular chaperone DnaJ
MKLLENIMRSFLHRTARRSIRPPIVGSSNARNQFLLPSFFSATSTSHSAQNYRPRRNFHTTTPNYNERDYYEVLGIKRNASKADIKKAYYAKAKQMHPDVNKDDPDATEKFAEVQSAYECLSDSEKKQSYDMFGHAGAGGNPFGGQGGGGGGGGNPFGGNDPFRGFQDIFGRQQQQSQQSMRNAPMRGGDVQTRLRIQFMEAITGCEKDITFRQGIQCEPCNGSGAQPGSTPATCGRCNGTGSIHVSRGFFQMQMACDQCGGVGEIISNPCTSCRGEGRSSKIRTVNVTIPRGVDTGINMRLAEQGDEGMRGGPSGSLYIEIEVENDSYFQRDGSDVHTDVSIRYSQAALGATVPLRTLDGEVELKVKSGTQPNDQVLLRNRGVHKLNGGERGHQYVRFVVNTPKELTDKQRELLEELEMTYDEGNRKNTNDNGNREEKTNEISDDSDDNDDNGKKKKKKDGFFDKIFS